MRGVAKLRCAGVAAGGGEWNKEGKRGATRGSGGERKRAREEEEAKAALFKQIRFGEIGLSLQDGG